MVVRNDKPNMLYLHGHRNKIVCRRGGKLEQSGDCVLQHKED